jgi:probable rRNA maturation factor
MPEVLVEITVIDHQQRGTLPGAWLELLEIAARRALPEVLARGFPGCPLGQLAALDVALLDDEAMGGVHGRFLGDPEPTDVITFEHGEILIGAETARRQAAEHGEPLTRELLRYLVHGMLHLAGHDDRAADDRGRMERVQEELVARLWAAWPVA